MRDSQPPELELEQAIELVNRHVLTVISPSSIEGLLSYAQAAQTTSAQQNVATAQNINSPNTSQFVTSQDRRP
jgi:uroporphyrinogen-III synthase